MKKPTLVSVHVGKPRTLVDPASGQTWTSGIMKEPVIVAVAACRTGLDGDVQADIKNHGGPDKAVLAYAEAHYVIWRHELNEPAIGPGGFGENLCVRDFDENDVCIGDVWELGNVRLEVSQPRHPCWKLERRWNRSGIVNRILETCRCGWYLRVIGEGQLEAGMPIRLVSHPHPQWTVARAFRVGTQPQRWPAHAAALSVISELSESWRQMLVAKR